jgi:hypothetical protein
MRLRLVAEQSRVLSNSAVRNARRQAHGVPADACIEHHPQLLAIGAAERRSAEAPEMQYAPDWLRHMLML